MTASEAKKWPRIWALKEHLEDEDAFTVKACKDVFHNGDIEYISKPEVDALIREARAAGIRFAIEEPIKAFDELSSLEERTNA